jgi:type IV pilus assembly protein PilV
MSAPRRRRARQTGVTLIEVLVSLVLIALAMFSALALQAYALRLASSSTARSQAITLATEIAERMEANRTQALTGAYATPTSSAASSFTTDCSQNPCAGADLVTYDLAIWSNKIVQSSLTSPTWTITLGAATASNPLTYTIAITWLERHDSAQNTTYVSGGTADTLTLTMTKALAQ